MQEPFFQALEVHFQPLDAQHEAKEVSVWAKEAGATLPVRECTASGAGGFLSGAAAVQHGLQEFASALRGSSIEELLRSLSRAYCHPSVLGGFSAYLRLSAVTALVDLLIVI